MLASLLDQAAHAAPFTAREDRSKHKGQQPTSGRPTRTRTLRLSAIFTET